MYNKLIRLFTGLIFFMVSCTSETAENTTADIAKSKLRIIECARTANSFATIIKSGDVITRQGNDFTSQSLRSLNQTDKTYSHIGIASVEHDSIFVYHALGGEFNPAQQLLREPFEKFVSVIDNNAFGIYRPVEEDIKHKVLIEAQKVYAAKIPFDMKFDLATDDKLYCAEFVMKSFEHASGNKIKFHHSLIKNFEFIGIDDITGNPVFKKITAVKYPL